jgi:hypothetical protein
MAKNRRISFRVDEATKDRIRDSAVKEDMTEADFTRRVFQWGFDQYLRVGEWSILRKIQVLSERKPPIFLAKSARG